VTAREKDERALEDRDQHRLAPLVVGGDLRAELADAGT
jgi:phenylpropionate dioxygenase-like ring-hydroxylating dioxygenase large terminal subunit